MFAVCQWFMPCVYLIITKTTQPPLVPAAGRIMPTPPQDLLTANPVCESSSAMVLTIPRTSLHITAGVMRSVGGGTARH